MGSFEPDSKCSTPKRDKQINRTSEKKSVINMASVHTNNPYSALQNNVNQALDELVADESVYVPNIEAKNCSTYPTVYKYFLFPMTKLVHLANRNHSESSDSSTRKRVRPIRSFKLEDGRILLDKTFLS